MEGGVIKSAREMAHDLCSPVLGTMPGSCCDEEEPDNVHSITCDRLTAAIEARDEEWNRNINANDRDWEARLAAVEAQLGALRTLLEHAVDNESAIVEVATRTSTPEGAAVPCEYHRELMRQWIKNVRMHLEASCAPSSGTDALQPVPTSEATEDAKESESFTALIQAAGPLPATGMASAEPPPQEPRCKTCDGTGSDCSRYPIRGCPACTTPTRREP